ncbi:MAG TPA: hypothetical protein VLV15_00955, partial [Dongiaceae bacterium]|nr:hypothetical protein [Dongiaceae bacterium]
TWIHARDATSGAPVDVHLDDGSFPLRSGVAAVVAEATELDVTAGAEDTVRTSRGATGATLLRLRLANPGVSGVSSNVRVASLGFALIDSAGGDRSRPDTTLSALRLVSGAQVLATHMLAPADGDTLVLALVPPVEIAANTPLDLALVGDLAATAPLGRFGARTLDSTFVDARDDNTRVPLPVHLTPSPLRGGPVTVEGPVDTMRVAGNPAMPAAVRIGDAGITAFTARFRHPGPPGSARIQVGRMDLQALDDLRRSLPPAAYLGRVRVMWNGTKVGDFVPAGNGGVVSVPLTDALIDPADTVHVEVRFDVSATAPAGYLELVVPLGGLAAADANTGAPVTVAAEPGTALPLASGLGRLTSPARDLEAGLASRLPAALAADGRPVVAGTLTLRNSDSLAAGAIAVDHLVARAADRDFAVRPLGAIASQVQAWRNGVPWAASGTLTPDSVSATLVASQPLSLDPGIAASLEIRLVTRIAAPPTSVRIGFDQADIGVVQPSSALLSVTTRPAAGLAFPMWTEVGSVSAADLQSSYVNFPNPFAAGREATTFAYYLPSPARVSLRILTPGGEVVNTLLDGVARSAGLRQSDLWDGRNGRGDVVYNGVYVAELDVRFDSGGSARLRRKVAVVR